MANKSAPKALKGRYVEVGEVRVSFSFVPPLFSFLPLHLHPPFSQDLCRLFPKERDLVQITLVEAKDILSSFDQRLRAYTERLIRKRKSMNILKASVTGTPILCHLPSTSLSLLLLPLPSSLLSHTHTHTHVYNTHVHNTHTHTHTQRGDLNQRDT